MSQQPIYERYTREQVLEALNATGVPYRAAQVLGCSHPSIGTAIKHYGIKPTEWIRSENSIHQSRSALLRARKTVEYRDEEAEATPANVLRGCLTTASSVIGDWSRSMGMKQDDSKGVTDFDVRIILEEARELEEAQQLEGRRGEIETLDALGDLVYVILNVAWRRNLPLAAAIAEIHRSNSTKTPNADGKPTKGEDYSEPDLEMVLLKWEQHNNPETRTGGERLGGVVFPSSLSHDDELLSGSPSRGFEHLEPLEG